MYGQVQACLKSFNFHKDACTLCKDFYDVNKLDAHTCTSVARVYLKNLMLWAPVRLRALSRVLKTSILSK